MQVYQAPICNHTHTHPYHPAPHKSSKAFPSSKVRKRRVALTHAVCLVSAHLKNSEKIECKGKQTQQIISESQCAKGRVLLPVFLQTKLWNNVQIKHLSGGSPSWPRQSLGQSHALQRSPLTRSLLDHRAKERGKTELCF